MSDAKKNKAAGESGADVIITSGVTKCEIGIFYRCRIGHRSAQKDSESYHHGFELIPLPLSAFHSYVVNVFRQSVQPPSAGYGGGRLLGLTLARIARSSIFVGMVRDDAVPTPAGGGGIS